MNFRNLSFLLAVSAASLLGQAAMAAPKSMARKAPAAAKVAAPPTVLPLKRTLPNGLTILVQENHAAPVVAVRMYVKTGSIYEGQYLGSGISHLFEHLLSEGTQTRSKAQINDEFQAIGGQSNAYTSKEVTAYHITTASSYFDRALNVLSDMMQNATFPEAEVKTQIGVIHNEMNLDADEPDREIYELFEEAAFKTHPVRYPIIGYRENFDRLTQADIVDYYKTHYTPGNTIVSVAGDVNAESVFAAVQKALGAWPRRNALTPTLPNEPLQTTPRRAARDKEVQLGYLLQGWHTVPLQHPDLYALDVLAEAFGGNESSRLVRALREDRNLVSSITAYSATPNYNGGVFGVRATCPPANIARVERAVLEQVSKVRREELRADEIARAKRQIETTFVFNNTDVEEQAEQIAYDEMSTGDPSYSRRYVARIKAVTPAQVRAVARKYLSGDGVTTAIIRPRLTAVARTASKATVVSAPQMIRLSNGVRLILRENHSTPTVSVVAMGLGGARLEEANQAGVANLSSRMLTRGTRKRNAAQIAGVVDDLGGQLSGIGGYNSWGVQSQWLSRDWRRGLSLVRESVLEPTFPASELPRAKAQIIAAIQEQQDDPNGAAGLLLRQTFFGPHPYGRSALGTPESVPKLTRADIQNYWKRVLQPQSTVVAIYGDINLEEARRAGEIAFGTWKGSGVLPKVPPLTNVLNEFTTREASKAGLAQTALWFGYPSIRITDADRYAIDILDAALSGVDLPGGRLHTRLRDNQLVYVVHAYNSPGLDGGMFVIYADTTKENRAQVQSIISEEVSRIRQGDISAEELERAKSMAIAAQAIANQTNSAQAQGAATDELLGVGYDESARYESAVSRISVEDVRRVAQKYLRSENAALAVVGPQ